MAEITKITIERDGKKVDVRADQLSNPLLRKLRKETERFFLQKRVVLNEPTYNEGVA